MAVVEPTAAAPENPLLRRRNSVMLPTKLSLPHQSSASTTTTTVTATASSSASSSLTNSVSDDFELFSIKPVSYTSLRDLLPLAAVNSPRPMATVSNGQSGSEISIRNRLVKQAAWAYLQPMSSSLDSSGRSLFSRFYFRFPVINPVAGVIEFVDRCIFAPLSKAVDWLLRAIRIRGSR
ncbi:uncharacterized protein LOC129887702 [Solanum dulcamara]|uniref:uncharacterized protein LOC129887702 n=1 Tax=Solanum dulcamara TaxID=45834 RepID=UPI0024855E52|nr:uncharacterized protein LOC129887702 [Solanum dulcamara]